MMSRALIVLCFLATAVFSQKVDKCCENECSTAGTEKYYSIARQFGKVGPYNCGESCIKPEDYTKIKVFEPNMVKANTTTPCLENGYTIYIETETHGTGEIATTVDLYTKDPAAYKIYKSMATCDSFTSQKTCMSSDADSGEHCSWCASSAVKSSCYVESDAKSLPSSIFACQYQNYKTAASCESFTSQKTCMANAADSGEYCSWCSSSAVKSSCYVESDAKALPSSIFACQYH